MASSMLSLMPSMLYEAMSAHKRSYVETVGLLVRFFGGHSSNARHTMHGAT